MINTFEYLSGTQPLRQTQGNILGDKWKVNSAFFKFEILLDIYRKIS